MDHFKLHSEYNPQETSLRLSKNWSIIIVLLIVVGISMVTFGSIVCNKLRQPQNYIEAVDSDSIEMKTAELLSGIDGTMMFRYNSRDTFKTLTDRFIQQAIAQVLTPIYEEQFHDHS